MKILKPIGWLLSEKNLEDFYGILYRSGKIDCTFLFFRSHFISGIEIEEQIVWLGNSSELVHCISELIDCRYIPYHRNYIVLLCAHFTKSNGEPLNESSCRVLKSRPTNTFVDNLIEILVDKIK